MTKAELISRLTELNRRLAISDNSAVLLVYGGFVMCVAYELKGQAMDIDCIYNNHTVDILAKEMAKEFKLNRDWINTDVKDIVHGNIKKQELEIFSSFSNLEIRIPSNRQMLAMKLYSVRLESIYALSDTIKLAKILGIKTKLQLSEVLREFFSAEVVIKNNITIL